MLSIAVEICRLRLRARSAKKHATIASKAAAAAIAGHNHSPNEPDMEFPNLIRTNT